MHPRDKIVPNKLVDAFWHAHILDTMKYAADCEHVFGHFVHHFPYFGLRGEEDARELQDAFATTKQRYENLFGAGFGDSRADGQASVCDAAQCRPDTTQTITVSSCQVSDCDAAQCDSSECHNISATGVALASLRPRFEHANC